MNTVQHNKIHNYHKIAAYPGQKSCLYGFPLETGSLLSKAGSYNANVCSAMFSFYKYYPAHQNREKNINKNVKSKPFPSPAMMPFFYQDETST